MFQPVYVLTVVKDIPVIIKCESQQILDEFKTKSAKIIGEDCVKANIESGNFVDKTNSDRVEHLINSHLSHVKLWAKREYAILEDVD